MRLVVVASYTKITETLPNRSSNTIRWSPRGRHAVLATVGSTSKSELEFWDLDFNLEDVGGRKDVNQTASKEEWGNGIQPLGSADHYGVTDVEWDPSGRYLATSASAWRHTVRGFSFGLLVFYHSRLILDLAIFSQPLAHAYVFAAI